MKWFLTLFTQETGTAADPVVTTETISDSQYKISQSGQEVLATEHRSRLIGLIKRSTCVTNDYWVENYFFALVRFAELVQAHPASRNHHHSKSGGLLDHTLDVLLRALRLSAGVILPPNTEPEDILHNAERWRFGIFIAALLHDVGKLISDQETVYKNQNGEFVRWLPWHGPIPRGREYAYRYQETRGQHIHGLHETIGITLLPYLLTPKMSRWLTSDRALLGQLMHTLSASATGSGVIGEIIRKADRNSTAESLGPMTELDENRIKPLHAKILESLQTLANEGKLKRNMPGAGVWVCKDRSWFVAKSTMEKIRDHLITSGHTGIPQSPLRLMQILGEHKLSLTPLQGDVQQAIVNDVQRDWVQKLSFIVIPNENIWISGTPNTFKGTITPVDNDGNPVEIQPLDRINEFNDSGSALGGYSEASTKVEDTSNLIPVTKPDITEHSEVIFPATHEVDCDLQPHSEPLIESQTVKSELHVAPSDILEVSLSSSISEMPNSVNDLSSRDCKSSIKPIIKSRQGIKKDLANPVTLDNSLRNTHSFFGWLLNGTKYRRIKVNQSGAPIHVLDGLVALVTPKVFDVYLDDNKAAAMALGKDRKQQIIRLQREIRELNLHLRHHSGNDFVRIEIRGPRKESSVHAMLFKLALFPELAKISPNPMLRLPDRENTP